MQVHITQLAPTVVARGDLSSVPYALEKKGVFEERDPFRLQWL